MYNITREIFYYAQSSALTDQDITISLAAVGTGTNQPKCPERTYSDQTGIDEESDCLECTPGFYCGTTGLSAPSGPCMAGK